MRNPKWHRDEIILALDLYFRLSPGQISASNPQIIELSSLLNRLPIHSHKPDAARFRNPNGVGLKLSNFLAIDDSYAGKGMVSYSQLDEAIFNEFKSKQKLLGQLASKIKEIASDEHLAYELDSIDVEDDEDYTAPEGKVLLKLHKYRERNRTLVKKKKDQYLKKHGHLACELCGFDFEQKYGAIGKGFIECHHKVPLKDLDKATKTKLDDLMLVCSNCHRMLHRRLDRTCGMVENHQKKE